MQCDNPNHKWHRPTLAKGLASIIFAACLPVLAIAIQAGVHSWQVYQFENAPLEKFYEVIEFHAYDVNLAESSMAKIELTRSSAGDYFASVGFTLEGIELKDASACCVVNFPRKSSGNEILIRKGEKASLIEQDLNEWFAKKSATKRGMYQWVFDVKLNLPYDVTRTVSYTSNVFTVTNQP